MDARLCGGNFGVLFNLEWFMLSVWWRIRLIDKPLDIALDGFVGGIKGNFCGGYGGWVYPSDAGYLAWIAGEVIIVEAGCVGGEVEVAGIVHHRVVGVGIGEAGQEVHCLWLPAYFFQTLTPDGVLCTLAGVYEAAGQGQFTPGWVFGPDYGQ